MFSHWGCMDLPAIWLCWVLAYQIPTGEDTSLWKSWGTLCSGYSSRQLPPSPESHLKAFANARQGREGGTWEQVMQAQTCSPASSIWDPSTHQAVARPAPDPTLPIRAGMYCSFTTSSTSSYDGILDIRAPPVSLPSFRTAAWFLGWLCSHKS